MEVAEYRDPDGSCLRLRCSLSAGTIRKVAKGGGNAAATTDDIWARRFEMLFEYLVVDWEISGLPLDDPKMLLGRYRIAAAAERRWVQATISAHLDTHIPELS